VLLPVSRRPKRIRALLCAPQLFRRVTMARMTHIMWLVNLAPDIQEAILCMPRVELGPDTVKEIDVRRFARVLEWGVQRGRWEKIAGLVSTT